LNSTDSTAALTCTPGRCTSASSAATLTPRDLAALEVVAQAGADWLALSFVRAPRAADELRAAARRVGIDVPVLAKIERPEAVAAADAILEAFDGVMVARGDLGVEIPLEQVPHVQKRLIELARRAAKPVVTATDMLDSMRASPRPTRAEASDVANAVYDGTDAVMLSGETAVGQFPVEALTYMDRIVRETEAQLRGLHRELSLQDGTVEEQVTEAACRLARQVGARAIIAPTLSGATARLVARHRPAAVVVAPAPAAVAGRRRRRAPGR
ncbi:MAG: pyruvate kinase, partial [Syntrophobacterales bacterium]|nr:pyruvate kinase [Syntrophobacterales bacterium]